VKIGKIAAIPAYAQPGLAYTWASPVNWTLIQIAYNYQDTAKQNGRKTLSGWVPNAMSVLFSAK